MPRGIGPVLNIGKQPGMTSRPYLGNHPRPIVHVWWLGRHRPDGCSKMPSKGMHTRRNPQYWHLALKNFSREGGSLCPITEGVVAREDDARDRIVCFFQRFNG